MDLDLATVVVTVLMTVLGVGLPVVYFANLYIKDAAARADKWERVALDLLLAGNASTTKLERERGIRPDRTQMRNQTYNWLVLYFSEEDMANLLFNFQIDYDSIEGKTLTGKAREMVEYFDRRGRLAELHQAILNLRPNAAKG